VQPSVSIVIPAYNNAAFIEATMRSVLAQTFENLDVVVADHASTDDTRRILDRFTDDPRVRVIDTPAGGGAARNWRRVTDEARGEYVKLVCGDDILHPDAVRRQVDAFEEGVVMVASRRDVVDAARRPIVRDRGLFGLVGRTSGRRAIRRTVRQGTNVFGEPACVMFRTADLQAAGSWDETESYLIDEATYISVLRRGDFVGVAETLAEFRVNAAQWSVRLARSQAREVAAFHARLRREHPGLVSAGDVLLGNARARLLALARRLLYVTLSRRLRNR
jgi:glycosyltransferase involved in cell wall biosynthesis